MKNIILFLVVITLCNCSNENAKINSLLNIPIDSLNISQISKEIRKNPTNAKLFMLRAEKYYALSLGDSAINDAIIATRLDTTNSNYFIRLSEMYLTSNNSEEAKSVLEKCSKINPNNDTVFVKLATIYFYIKNYKKSAEYLDMAAGVNPHNANMFFIRGMIHREKKEAKAAILNFQKAAENNADYYDAYMMLGLSFAEQNDSIAIQYYKTAIKLEPKDEQAYYNLALYYQNNNKLNEAINEYQFIINKINKSYFSAYFNKGYVYMIYLNDLNKAISCFDSALAIKPDYVEAIYNKGYCYELKKDYKKAREFYEQSKTIVTNYQLAIDGLNRLDKK